MKVLFVKDFKQGDVLYRAGTVADVPRLLGMQLVRDGIARERPADAKPEYKEDLDSEDEAETVG